MISEEVKVKALLASGKRPRDIAEMETVTASYSTIIKWRNALREEAEAASIEEVTAIDPVALQVIVDHIPPGEIDMSESLQTVVKGSTSLAALDTQFHTTIGLLLNRAVELLAEDTLTPNGLKIISGAISESYGAIHAKGTSITMNQNSVSTEGISKFKGVMR